MKVLVVGNGGREHALAWKLLQSPQVDRVVCVPGNGGTAASQHDQNQQNCQNLPLAVDDFAQIGKYAVENNIALVVVGPEVPLAKGIVDYLQQQGLKVFGPVQAAAQIEASKIWAKGLMQAAGIPTAKAEVFHTAAAAKSYVQSGSLPIVIKADGLAAGKGVTVAHTLADAEKFITAIFQGEFGSAGNAVVVEEFLSGEEVSILALTDGLTIRPLLPAQDHKRIGEGDTGENTGGMGAYAPAPVATPELMSRIQTEVLERAIAALRDKGIDYRGVLYAGLMITPDGDFKVLEFNCRFGDPETQVILPLLETPLEELMFACIEQRLAEIPPIAWKKAVSANVVIASGGYPGKYSKGEIVAGLEVAEDAAMGVKVFHAGTTLNQQEKIITDGGRVLNVNGLGADFPQAFAKVYDSIQRIYFPGMYYRRDIGHRVRE